MNLDAAWEDADLLTDAIVGWRTWRLDRASTGLVLAPAGNGRGDWPARVRLVATCRAHPRGPGGPVDPHRSPDLDCTCGVYASDTLRSLVTPIHRFPPLPVVGTVALWGRVVEHARGWRAEFAYPDRLRLVCGACLSAGDGVGIPSVVVETRGRRPEGRPEVVPMCPDHLTGLFDGTRIFRDAATIQGELLSRYAVDLLPFEAIASLFQREPVPGPVPYRPRAIRPAVPVSSPPVVAPQPVEAAPVPRSSRALERLKRIGNGFLTAVVWIVIAWWGCSDTFVTVEVP